MQENLKYKIIILFISKKKSMAGPKGKPAAGAGSDEMKFITMKVVGGEPPSNAV